MINEYEQKVKARRERLTALAERKSDEANATYERAKVLAERIPFGQPILIGHHSEKRDRSYRAKINRTFEAAFKAQEDADKLRERAESVGAGGISSDDPDAIKKLTAQIEEMEHAQERMKAANKVILKNKTTEDKRSGLIAAGFSPAHAVELLTPDCMGRIGFASYQLQNNGANIRRVRGRIAVLQKAATRVEEEIKGEGWTVRTDKSENRVIFVFEEKPSREVVSLLKSRGFKWSPTRVAWVRQLNNAAIYAAKEIIRSLKEGGQP